MFSNWHNNRDAEEQMRWETPIILIFLKRGIEIAVLTFTRQN